MATSNFHTPIADGQPGSAPSFNAPLQELDQAITDLTNGLIAISSLAVTGNIDAGGDLGIGGDGNIAGLLEVGGILTVAGLFTAEDNVDIGGTLHVDEAVTLDNSLDVAGAGTINGLITGGAGITVTGNGTVSGTMDIGGAATIGGNTAITGNVSATGYMSALTGAIIGDTVNTGIVSDNFTVTNSLHVLDTESLAVSDDLQTISGGVAGRLLFVRINNAARTITFVNNVSAGGILTVDGKSWVMDSTSQVIALVFNGTNWIMVNTPNQQHLRVGLEGPKVISGDAISVTLSAMVVDTEGLGTTDDLSTISGGLPGQIVTIRTTNAARVVTIKHNVGNILTATGDDIALSNPNNVVTMFYNGTSWFVTGGTPIAISMKEADQVSYSSLTNLIVPRNVMQIQSPGIARLRFMPDFGYASISGVQASGITTLGVGIANPTVAGSSAAINLTTTKHIRYTTGGSNGNYAGWQSLFNLFQRGYNPTFRILVGMGTVATLVRAVIGFTSALLTNVDVPAGHFAGFRFSTATADVNWMCLSKDAVTTETSDSGVPVVVNTEYFFEIEMSATGVNFYINNVLVATHTVNMPGLTQDLGTQLQVTTLQNSAKNFSFARSVVVQD